MSVVESAEDEDDGSDDRCGSGTCEREPWVERWGRESGSGFIVSSMVEIIHLRTFTL